LKAGRFFETRFDFAGWTLAAAFRFDAGAFVPPRVFVLAVRFFFAATFFFDTLARLDAPFRPAIEPLAILIPKS